MFGILFLGLVIWVACAWKKKGKDAEAPKRIEIDQEERKRQMREARRNGYKVGMKIVSMLAKR